MIKYLLLSCIILFSFKSNQLPEGWRQIEKAEISGEKVEIFFFDYMSKLDEIKPDYLPVKGKEFLKFLENVYFQYPTYVAKKVVANEDSVVYFILRPNASKSDNP